MSSAGQPGSDDSNRRRLAVAMDAKLDKLSGLQQAVAKFGVEQGWPPDWEYQVELVIEELVVNIVSYGFAEDVANGRVENGRVEVVLDSGPDDIRIDILDNGRPFDPFSEAPLPDTDSSVEERPIGGLGVHFVKTMMDAARYRREGDKNHVTLIKRCQG